MDNEQKGCRSTFKVAPFPERMGTTIGNAVRRTLLSRIEGTAVTAVWIEGATHECAVLPGVKEDVVDLIAHLRQLKVRLSLTDSATLTLRAESEGKVTAADIAPQPGVEILHPDLRIATLDQGAALSMRIYVERGIGWRSAQENRKPEHPFGTLPVASHFSPVEKAAYRVEQAEEGEALVVHIETDETLSPRRALQKAVEKLSDAVGAIRSAAYEDTKGTFTFDVPDMEITIGSALEDALFEMDEVLDARYEADPEQGTMRLHVQTEEGMNPREALGRAETHLLSLFAQVGSAEEIASDEASATEDTESTEGWGGGASESSVISVANEVKRPQEPEQVIDLSKTKDIPEAPDLLELQMDSFRQLIVEEEGDLAKILRKIFPISGGGAILECVDWGIGKPCLSAAECIRSERDYVAPVRLHLKLSHSGHVREEVLSFDLPMMTDRASFVLHGAERVLVTPLPFGEGEDGDDLSGRRCRGPGEVLGEVLREALMRIARAAQEHIEVASTNGMGPRELFNLQPLREAIRTFFETHPLSQPVDQTNPLSEVTHKRRFTAMGPGGTTREEAGPEYRGLHPSYYGRICPIETPEGPNIGLITSMALYAKVDENGVIRTPYHRVVDGGITDEIVMLPPEAEEKAIIAPAYVPKDDSGRLIGDEVPARVEGIPTQVAPKEVQYMDGSPYQMLGVSSSLIPLMNHDDPSRVLMGSNMQRQAVPLIHPEPPLIQTGSETQVVRDSRRAVTARAEGVVQYVDAARIVVRRKDRQEDVYRLDKFVSSQGNTIFNQKPIVCRGQTVVEGQILADGPSMKDGALALGRNLLVAVLPWEGTNFEDALVINARLVRDDVFTSSARRSFRVEVRETEMGPEVVLPDPSLPHLDENGIVRVGTRLSRGLVLVNKRTPAPNGTMRDAAFRVPLPFTQESDEIVAGVEILTKNLPPGIKQVIRIETAARRPLQVGDKMSTRHGNKGTVAKILPEEDMPLLPDGTPVDLVLNPVGFISRLTFGTILETHLGWAARTLGARIISPPFDGATISDVGTLLEKAGLPPSGMAKLRDGRTGRPFDSEVLVGVLYMMKLSHLVEDKIHARSTGPYDALTQQPLGGKAHFGGQRFGTMEIWALEAHGAAYTLQEMLTLKSDDVEGRARLYDAVARGEGEVRPTAPEAAKTMEAMLKGAGLELEDRK